MYPAVLSTVSIAVAIAVAIAKQNFSPPFFNVPYALKEP
jgi:hypothetical protein